MESLISFRMARGAQFLGQNIKLGSFALIW